MRPLNALYAAATLVAGGSNDGQASSSNVVPSLWDGHCYYPTGDPGFNLESYLGRWYQVAGTLAPFTAGCKCISANYALNVSNASPGRRRLYILTLAGRIMVPFR